MLRIGVFLMLLSFVPWLLLPAVPWLQSTPGDQARLTGALLVSAELLFWPGLALAGRPTWNAAKAHGWRRVIPVLWRMLRTGVPEPKPTPGPAEQAPKADSNTTQ